MNPRVSILKKQLSIFFVMFFFVANSQNTFIENKGQLPKSVVSKAHLPSGSLFIEKGKLIYAFYDGEQLAKIHDGLAIENEINAHAYSVSFLNKDEVIASILEGESNYFENYYIGDDKSSWASNVKSFKQQIQEDVYKGIDFIFYVEDDKLKYEFHIEKSIDASVIRLQYDGVNSLSIQNGNLLINTSVNNIVEHSPYCYQIINGVEVEIPCNYQLKKNILSFSFPEGYNRDYDLIIDPVLEFSTYSGSTTDNFGYTATYDNFGFLYSGSTSFGVGYPTTLGAYQISYANPAGGTDIAITKYDTSGTQRIYSTYLGGTKDELPHSMIVNSSNELFIFGTTASSNFPTSLSAYQDTFKGGPAFSPAGLGVSFPNGSDIFVSRLSANGGNLMASTFIGGTDNDGLNLSNKLKFNYADEVRGEIDIDKQNNIYLATSTKSTDFPVFGGVQSNNNGGQEGCIIRMDNQLTSIIWSSYLGGSGDDAIYSLALDKDDNIYVTGGTQSDDYPTTLGAYQTTFQDSLQADAFVSLLSSSGNQLLSSSYYGSEAYDQSYFVEVGSTQEVYLFGQTKASGQTLVENSTYFTSGAGQFIAVFSKELDSISRSTVVGTGNGTPDISPTAFLVDICDKIYLSGWGSSTGNGPLSTLNLSVSSNAYQSTTDGNDFYLMVVDDALSSLVYASYFGGSQSAEHVDGGTSRFDKKGVIYQSVCAGCGGNSDFPIEPNPGAVSSTNNSPNCNNGVFKFNFDFPMVIADFNAPFVGCDSIINFQNLSSSNSTMSYSWDFGDGSTSTLENPTYSFSQPGNHIVTLITSAPGACNVVDTISKNIYILSNKKDTLDNLTKCEEENLQIGLTPINNQSVSYLWFPSSNLSSINIPNPYCNATDNSSYQLLISNGSCTDTLVQEIIVQQFSLEAGSDTAYCNQPILLTADYNSAVSSVIWSTNSSFTDTLSQDSSLLVASIDTFYVMATDGNCVEIDSVAVTSKKININLAGDLDLCKGDSIYLFVENLTPNYPLSSYLWSPAPVQYISDSSSIISSTDSSIWYSVLATNEEGCFLKDSVFIEVNENPIIDSLWLDRDTIFRGEHTYLNIETEDNFTWHNFTSTLSRVKIEPSFSECYSVDVFNVQNCVIVDSICIKVLDVFCSEDSLVIPTAFSPNQDQVNDYYFIDDKQGIITDFKLEIFNRLGQKVFYTEDIYTKWDGTFRGIELSPQVFDFYLELKCVDNKSMFKKGNITLIR